MAAVFVTGGSGYLGASLVPALLKNGYTVRALARSSQAAERLRALGASPVTGDLSSEQRLVTAMSECELAVHAAGRFREGGPYREYFRDNVEGTGRVLAAARSAGVKRLVYVGAAGSLIGQRPVIDADESWPLQRPRYSAYFKTKAIADGEVLKASTPGFSTCVVRPGLIWGGREDPFLDAIAEATRQGKMMLIDGGRHRVMTSHVENTVHCILLALEKARSGEAYYVFDDDAVEMREFLTALLATRGLPPPTRAIPAGVAWVIASAIDGAWAVLRRPGEPPINRTLVKLNSGPFLVSDRKARKELGYLPVVSRKEAIGRLAPPETAPKTASTASAT